MMPGLFAMPGLLQLAPCAFIYTPLSWILTSKSDVYLMNIQKMDASKCGTTELTISIDAIRGWFISEPMTNITKYISPIVLHPSFEFPIPRLFIYPLQPPNPIASPSGRHILGSEIRHICSLLGRINAQLCALYLGHMYIWLRPIASSALRCNVRSIRHFRHPITTVNRSQGHHSSLRILCQRWDATGTKQTLLFAKDILSGSHIADITTKPVIKSQPNEPQWPCKDAVPNHSNPQAPAVYFFLLLWVVQYTTNVRGSSKSPFRKRDS